MSYAANAFSVSHILDVIAELNNILLPAHDILYEVGSFTAYNHVFCLVVTDGQLRKLQPRPPKSPS